MEITYDYYRIFYYAAKYKSFSKAADMLMSNQPNITHFMNNLENQLGCRLFVRSNRGVTLTREGEKLYKHVCIAYQHFHMAELEIANDRSLQSGVITIGVSEIALHVLLLPILAKFRKAYPGIRLRLSNHSTPDTIQEVKDGLTEIAVVSTPADIPSGLKSTSLMKFSDIMVVSKNHEEFCQKEVHLADMQSWPLICLGKGTKSYEFYNDFYRRYGLKMNPDIEASTIHQVLPMVIYDLGVGFLPENVATDALKEKKICKVPLIEKIPEREICMIEEKRSSLSIAANALKQFIHQYLQDELSENEGERKKNCENKG